MNKDYCSLVLLSIVVVVLVALKHQLYIDILKLSVNAFTCIFNILCTLFPKTKLAALKINSVLLVCLGVCFHQSFISFLLLLHWQELHLCYSLLLMLGYKTGGKKQNKTCSEVL